jgi:hypothetical protein
LKAHQLDIILGNKVIKLREIGLIIRLWTYRSENRKFFDLEFMSGLEVKPQKIIDLEGTNRWLQA